MLKAKAINVKNLFVALFFLCSLVAEAQRPAPLPVGSLLPARQVPAHDPVMIKEEKTYYLFCTGPGIQVWSSNDLRIWRKEAPVFSKPPQWALDTIRGFKGTIWAPDISFHHGLYYLYYTVSAFGKNTSAIGVATAKTLDSSSKDFGWTDHGRVVQSFPNKSNWNAIDPNLAVDEKGTPYLVFGSFWDGLKMMKLTKDYLQPAVSTDNIPTVARRKKVTISPDSLVAGNFPVNAGDNAIEGPFIYKKGAHYYFFASIDYCCAGPKSTYKMIVGRAAKIEGPYVDKEGRELRNGGGTILLQGDQNWYGVGHNGLCAADGKDYIVYHGYDAADNGSPKLQIGELGWDNDGWPVINTLDTSIH